jgi:hypothetical protein
MSLLLVCFLWLGLNAQKKKPAERYRVSGPDDDFTALNLYPHTSTDTPIAW